MPPVIQAKKKQFRAVGAYIFAGGFTVGVKAAGFDVLCHLEETDYGVKTFKTNFPDINVYYPPESWPIDDLTDREDVDFVYGNPPCAAWSGAGSAHHHGGTWRDSKLIDCTRRHFGLLGALRPRVWAWESVQRAWTVGREMVTELAVEAKEMGYSTTVWLHDAQWLGVPQRRKRFFMICHDVDLKIPIPTWKSETIDAALKRVKNVGDPIDSNIKRVAHLLARMRGGESLCGLWTREIDQATIERNARGQVRGRPTFAITRARSGFPAPVVRHEMVHPTEDRGLSVKELQVLTGYPERFEFVGSGIPHQIGRGVCPPVGATLAKFVKSALKSNVKIKRPYFALVNHTSSPGETLTTEDYEAINTL